MLKTLMKAALATSAILLAVTGCQMVRNSGDEALPNASDAALRVATYNVHYIILSKATGPWSLADWERRKRPLDQAFKAMDADVIGFQEMESFAHGGGGTVNLTLDWLLERNPEYGAGAIGDVAQVPSTQPIFYRKARLALLDQGWFFFSETPDVIYSRTFNGSYPAFASWVELEDRASGKKFRVINVHTDYASRNNRKRSLALVAQRIKPWIAAGENLFVIGDMNARAREASMVPLARAGVSFVPLKGSSYHFNRGLNLFGAIDHIGSVGAARLAREPIVLRQRFDGEWPTDHYPVIADFEW